MSKTRWILASLILVCGLVVGPLAPASAKTDQHRVAVMGQKNGPDWCCLAGLSCCVQQPGQ
jgi:hypothetical protein